MTVQRFVGVVLAAVASTSAFAFDPSPLPASCQSTLSDMQTDKAKFADLGKQMTRYRKASDTENFCKAARDIVVLIKEQSDKLDSCVGELSAASSVPQNTTMQMLELRSVYKQMLTAAKDAKNDRFHCGLADQ